MADQTGRARVLFVSIMLLVLIVEEWALVCLPWQMADRLQMIPAAILVVFVLWLIFAEHARLDREGMLWMVAGLCMIAAGDFFLCFLCGFEFAWGEPLGFIGFTLCQLCFAMRMQITRKNLLLRILIFAVMECILFLMGMMDFGNFFGIFNLSQLLVNVLTAFYGFKWQRRPWKELVIGLLCFAGCDYGLLVHTLLPYTSSIKGPVGMFVWFCYVPAQIYLLLHFWKISSDS